MPRRPKTPAPDSPYPPGWEPFLAAIKGEMFDDTPRLVFADWLQENGDEARAEFIRLQCRLRALRYDDPEVPPLAARADILLQVHRERWLVGLPAWFRKECADSPFPRGFVTYLSVTGARFLKDGAAITRLTPIDDLSLSRATPEALRSPALSDVGGLSLSDVDSARVEALAGHPDLSNLRCLFVSNGSDNDRTYLPTVRLSRGAIQSLLANRTLCGLQRLEFKCRQHGDAVASGVAAGSFTRLEDMSLYSSGLSADGLKALVNSASAPTLTNLHLAGNRFGDPGVRHMVEAPALTRLECLNLLNCGLTAESVRLLAEWPGLRTVRWLQLGSDDALTDADAEPIRNSPHAVSLRDFRVRG